MTNYRFHLLSLVHLPQSKTYLSCAFTQKNRKLAKMLTSLGHEVFFYGCEGSDVEEYCNSDKLHFIQTHTLQDIRDDYGMGDNRFEIGYDWTSMDFRHDWNRQRKPSTQKFIDNCINFVGEIKKPSDFLLITQGQVYKPIVEAVKLYLTCESGIGYRGSYPGHSRAFESAYIQNFTYGSENPYKSISGNYYDRVIPNYFDPDDIAYSPTKDDYYLYMGRMIRRKGLLVAKLVADTMNIQLVIAGQGAHVDKDGTLRPNEHKDFSLPKGHWHYTGFVDLEKRKKLLARAKLTLVPTEYLEPFAGIHIESMLSGTPVLTTSFGVFPETVVNGINGYRCNTLQDFVTAARKCEFVQPSTIRESAEKYLMENVRWEFQKWFDDLYHVYQSTLDPNIKGWHRLEKTLV